MHLRSEQKNTPMKSIPMLIGTVTAVLLLAVCSTNASAISESDWLKELAQNGDANAQLQLGLAYRDGHYGLQIDPHAGLHWLTLSAENGNAYAADLAGNAYAAGVGTQANQQKAIHWWQIAAREGNADAERRLALQQLASNKRAQGIDWLRRAADRGDSVAHQLLVKLYGSNGVNDADLHRGENLLDALGERLQTPGLRSLFAVWEVYKESSPYMHSAEALLASAKAGDPDAEYALALRYRDGSWAVAKDQQQASVWLRRSAAAGNPIAIKTLTKNRLGRSAVPSANGSNEHL